MARTRLISGATLRPEDSRASGEPEPPERHEPLPADGRKAICQGPHRLIVGQASGARFAFGQENEPAPPDDVQRGDWIDGMDSRREPGLEVQVEPLTLEREPGASVSVEAVVEPVGRHDSCFPALAYGEAGGNVVEPRCFPPSRIGGRTCPRQPGSKREEPGREDGRS